MLNIIQIKVFIVWFYCNLKSSLKYATILLPNFPFISGIIIFIFILSLLVYLNNFQKVEIFNTF